MSWERKRFATLLLLLFPFELALFFALYFDLSSDVVILATGLVITALVVYEVMAPDDGGDGVAPLPELPERTKSRIESTQTE